MNKFFTNLRRALRGRITEERSVPVAITALIIGIVIMVNAVVYALDVMYGLYLYSANEVDLSVSQNVDEIFTPERTAGVEVTILFCKAEEDVKNDATGGWVYITAKNLAERYSFIKLDYVNVLSEPEAVISYQTDPAGHTYTIYESSVIFICRVDGQVIGYRVVTDITTGAGYGDFYTLDSSNNVLAYNGEEVMVSMILWSMQSTHPKAYFTVYHGESTTSTFTTLLTCAGYYIETLDLRAGEIPSDADLVIISSPTNDLERAAAGSTVRSEIARLEDYVAGGGNVLVSLDPYLKKQLPVLTSFLSEYGLSVSKDGSEDNLSKIVRDRENGITSDGFTLVLNVADGDVAAKIGEHISKADAGNVVISSTASLTLGEGGHALLTSSSSSTEESDGKVLDRAGSYTVVAYGEKENSGKVVLIPSIYLAAQDALVSQGYANKDFYFGIFEELFGREMMPYGCRDVLMTNTTLENLTMGTARRMTALLFLVPALLTGLGITVIVRRKNR